MSKASSIAGAILVAGMASAGPIEATAALPAGKASPEPVAKAVDDVLVQASEGEIAGFRWGSPVSTLASSKQVRPSPNISVRCSADIASAERADCTAFVPTVKNSFARAYYATSRDGLLMVESNATYFDCAHFEDMASPSAGHRRLLAANGWNYLRRDRRPEGVGAIVETQWFARNGIGLEFTFIKAARANACGVKSFVSKML